MGKEEGLDQKLTDEAVYARLLEEHNKREFANSDAYDKALLTFTTGALALSLTFIKDLVPVPSAAIARWALLSAWCLWLVALFTIIASFMVSLRAGRLAIQWANRDLVLKTPDPAKDITAQRWAVAVLACNAVAGILFALGSVFMVYFVYENLEVTPMATQKQDGHVTTTAVVGDGMPVAFRTALPNAPEERGFPVPHRTELPPPPPPEQPSKPKE